MFRPRPATRCRSTALAAAVVAAAVVVSGCSTGAPNPQTAAQPPVADASVAAVSPALAAYDERVVGDLWNRPGLSERDRSIVTVASLIAGDRPAETSRYVERALDSGVEPREISEIVTHLAFYAGWPKARAAAEQIAPLFSARRIDASKLPVVNPQLLPLDTAADDARARQQQDSYGDVAPGVLEYTTDVVFRDLWLRPDLAPRDRSLVTVSALVSTGQAEQVSYHLGRAMDNGLTRSEASETLTQLAFYAGCPRVFSALPVVDQVLASRS